MGWNSAYRLGIGIVVAKLFFLRRLLPLHHGRGDIPLLPEPGPKRSQQFSRFRKTFDQNVAGSFERRFRIRHVDRLDSVTGRLHDQILDGFLLRLQHRIGQQDIGQWLQTRLTGNLRTRAPLRLVRQI